VRHRIEGSIQDPEITDEEIGSSMVETKSATTRATRRSGFTADERAAMRERAREAKAGNADGESDVLAKIAAMPAGDRHIAERIHAVVKQNAPALSSRTWYGMPAYAKDGNVVFFFKCADKFKSRYATLGFSDKARLDDGEMWPTEFALKEWTAANEERIRALIMKAVG
jgi:uncharacterized protein YdhG (YjbR/CyaY superfamily)